MSLLSSLVGLDSSSFFRGLKNCGRGARQTLRNYLHSASLWFYRCCSLRSFFVSRADDVNSPRGDDTGLSPFNCNEDPFIEPFMRGVIETLAQEEWEGRKFDSDGGSASWPADFSAAPVSCL